MDASTRKRGWGVPVIAFSVFFAAALLFSPYVERSSQARARASCQGTLKQWGNIFKMYADEYDGFLPRVQGPDPWLADGVTTDRLGADCGVDEGPNFTPNPPSVFPEYMTDLHVLQCPANDDPDLYIVREGYPYAGIPTRGDASFQYFGYLLVSDDAAAPEHFRSDVDIEELGVQLRQLFAVFAPLRADVRSTSLARSAAALLDGDLPVTDGTGTNGSSVLRRLRMGAERYFISDGSFPGGGPVEVVDVPVMWDKFGPVKDGVPSTFHPPHGTNVLFLDGHVEWKRYERNGRFPVNRALPEAFRAAGLGLN